MKDSYNYPLLKAITDAFPKQNESLKDVHICACQHLMEPQEKMFALLSDFGIPKENIHTIGKIYSTNAEVLKELQDSGFDAKQPAFDPNISFDDQHRENCEDFFSELLEKLGDTSTVIIIDDGAELLNVFNERKDKLPSSTKIVGIEQTSSGFRKLENKPISFPIINVARSKIKLDKESPLIARLGCDRIEDVIRQYNIAEPRILVVGLGPMGNNTMLILQEVGYFVTGHDTAFHSEKELVDFMVENRINMVVGVTGKNILTPEQITKLDKKITTNIYLVSMSSSDREFPATFLRNGATQSSDDMHGDIRWNHITLINNGFPITFKGKRYESTPIEIEKTIALLYGSALYASTSEITDPGFVDVPEMVTDVIEKNE
jgi:S-adenosylhomocysteine hydrolase